MKICIFTLLFFLNSINTRAQLTQGIINYKITYKNIPQELDYYVNNNLMPHEQKVFFCDTAVRIESIAEGGSQTMIFSKRSKNTYILLTVGKSDLAVLVPNENLTEKYTLKRKKKSFANHICTKATSAVSEVYYTTSIDRSNNTTHPGIDGVPLSYTYFEEKNYETNFEATTVSSTKNISSFLFQIPKEYRIISVEDFLTLED